MDISPGPAQHAQSAGLRQRRANAASPVTNDPASENEATSPSSRESLHSQTVVGRPTAVAVSDSSAPANQHVSGGQASGSGDSAADGRESSTAVENNGEAEFMRTKVIVTTAIFAAFTTGAVIFVVMAGVNRVFPLAIAACVATFSSILLRFLINGITGASHAHSRPRYGRHYRRFTGERAAYVRTSQRLAMVEGDFTAAHYEMLLDLDNNSQRLRRFLEGASQGHIDRLPTYIYKASPGDTIPGKASKGAQPSSAPAGDIGSSSKPADGASERNNSCPTVLKAAPTEASADPAPTIPTHPELGGDTVRSCTICLEDFETGMTIRMLPCFHRFMVSCIDPWLLQQARCPVCKASIHDDFPTMPEGPD